MVLPGHLSAGYLLTEGILHITNAASFLTPQQVLILAVFGTLAGDAPDIDLLAFSLAQKIGIGKVEQHREYITHKPLFWLITCGTIVLAGSVIHAPFIELLGLILFAGSWSHLILDSIEYGVTWLWPFSNTRYALSKHMPANKVTATPGSLRAHYQFVRYMYAQTWTFWAELAVTLAAIWVFYATFC